VADEWLVEKYGTSRRRSWRKLHIGAASANGEIAAAAVTPQGYRDAATADILLDPIADPVASFTPDSGYNLRAKIEASIGRYKRVIDDALRSRTDRPRRPRSPLPPLP
jgi:hypothetical protein